VVRFTERAGRLDRAQPLLRRKAEDRRDERNVILARSAGVHAAQRRTALEIVDDLARMFDQKRPPCHGLPVQMRDERSKPAPHARRDPSRGVCPNVRAVAHARIDPAQRREKAAIFECRNGGQTTGARVRAGADRYARPNETAVAGPRIFGPRIDERFEFGPGRSELVFAPVDFAHGERQRRAFLRAEARRECGHAHEERRAAEPLAFDQTRAGGKRLQVGLLGELSR